ncbi:MAG: saccharopine dehydrogenase family protein [Candidatus Methanofastidiosia archaeon]
MYKKTFLILGGYGNAGQYLARLLLQETDVHLVLAGRSSKNAEQAAAQLNDIFEGDRVAGIRTDASDTEDLKKAFGDVDFALVASSTVKYVKKVARAALEAGIDYLDIQYSTKKAAVLQSMAGKIEKAGSCFITEAGFHPGLPAAMVRYVAQYFDLIEKANVGSVIKINWRELSLSQSTTDEFMEEMFDFETLFFKDGKWKKARMLGMMDYITMDFGREFGKQYCVPMFFDEMRSIPKMYPSLREAGFFVGGFNWFVDFLVLPLSMVALRIWPQGMKKPMERLMDWGLVTFSSPPYGVVLKIEATGEKDDHAREVKISLHYKDGYMFTAIPVVACLLQYLDGSAKKPGLWMMGHLVDPTRLMKDMERMGIEVRIKEKRGNGR